MLLTRPLHAQDSRNVVLRFRKAGDTMAIRNARVTIDHTFDAGVTNSLGMVRVPDLEDGGHIVEAVARGYQAFFDEFTSGPNVRMPIDLEVLACPPDETEGAANRASRLRIRTATHRGSRQVFHAPQL